MTEFSGYQHQDFVEIQTPTLTEAHENRVLSGLTPDLAAATLEYFVESGDRLSKMTKTYHDVEAVTRLLQEKETDLELAAKIGQELLERNRKLEEKVAELEAQQIKANDLITQLRHELTVKSDLLHSYASDFAEEADMPSPMELRALNVDLMKKKVRDLEEDNRKLQEEATELAKEAFACEEKEEKLVSDAVKHLSETNFQLAALRSDHRAKVEECLRQKEEITQLLAQVVDLQAKVKRFTCENCEVSTQLQIYKETQDDLTAELSDFKEKYREVLDLLHDTQDEMRDLKRNQKAHYAGLGQHNVDRMFESENVENDDMLFSGETSLMSEIHSSLKSSKRSSKRTSKLGSSKLDSASDFSDSDCGGDSTGRRSVAAYLNRAFATCKLANSKKMPHVPDHLLHSEEMNKNYVPGQGSSLDQKNLYFLPVVSKNLASYTISRNNSTTDFLEIAQEFGSTNFAGTIPATTTAHGSLGLGQGDVSNATSGFFSHGHPEIGHVGTLDNLLTTDSPKRGHPGLGQPPVNYAAGDHNMTLSNNVVEVQTIGTLVPPSQNFQKPEQLNTVPLGSLPSMINDFDELDSHCVDPDSGGFDVALGDRNMGDGMSDVEFDEPEAMSQLDEFPHYKGVTDININTVAHKQMQLERTLQNLNPMDVEKRRMMSFGGVGSVMNLEEDFSNMLPYGVRAPDSILSTGSRDLSSFDSFQQPGWKLPDKLRIVKPLEGSLTLHNWQQLAMPSLGGILEERKGIAFKSGLSNKNLIDMPDEPSDFEDDDLETANEKKLKQGQGTFTKPTLTNSVVLHPIDDATTQVTSTLNKSQMSCGFSNYLESQYSSKLSSRYSSIGNLDSPELYRPTARQSSRTWSESRSGRDAHRLTYSSNIGLKRLLGRRDNLGLAGSVTNLDQVTAREGSPYITKEMAANISKLTPSALGTPWNVHSPPGTPLNSPSCSRSSSKTRSKSSEVPEDGDSIVSGFFSKLKTALYGEQEKEAKKKIKKKRFGILEMVEEVGVENIMSGRDSSVDSDSESSFYMSGSKTCKDFKNIEKSSCHEGSSEFEDIQPGSLTIMATGSKGSIDGAIGQLSAPFFSIFGRPNLNASELGKVPARVDSLDPPIAIGGVGLISGRGPGRVISSPGEKRPNFQSQYGVPGVPGTGDLARSIRPDLGQVPVRSRSDDENVSDSGFVGAIGSLFFGRKGGLL